MSKPKRLDIQKRFERRLDFIFGGRMSDDDTTLAMEEERAEAVSDDKD